MVGYSDLSRFYKTADGWIYLDACEQELHKFAAIDELSGLAAATDRVAYLKSVIGRMSSSGLQARLQAANIAAAVPDNIDHLRSQYSRTADGLPGTENGSYSFSIYSDHPSGHRVTQLDPYAIRPRVARIRALPPAEKFGASTRKVLGRYGYTERRFSRSWTPAQSVIPGVRNICPADS